MTRRIETPGLLVRSVPYGESDLVTSFFTRDMGKVSAIVRGARRSRKRFGGALEPMHGLHLTVEDKGRELCTLLEARVERPRTELASSLEAMEAAGLALRWVRHVCPPRTPEPAVWGSLERLLADLDDVDVAPQARALVAVFGLRLMADVGYAIELDRCVKCGRVAPVGRKAFFDAAGGGLVCTRCGGASRTIAGSVREAASRAQRGEGELPAEVASEVIAFVEDAMAAHAGFEPASA